jgi:hypothetical protein
MKEKGRCTSGSRNDVNRGFYFLTDKMRENDIIQQQKNAVIDEYEDEKRQEEKTADDSFHAEPSHVTWV